MASNTVPEHIFSLADRADWFHLQAGCAVERLRWLASLQEVDGTVADFLFLIADELERQADAFEPAVVGLRQVERRRLLPLLPGVSA